MEKEDDLMSLEEAFEEFVWPELQEKVENLPVKDMAREFFIAGYTLAMGDEEDFEDEDLEEE